MNWFSSLLRGKAKPQKKMEEPTSFTLRQGKTVPVDDAFRAWTSGDLNEMLKAVSKKTNLIDRHYLLQSIVDATYKLRKEEAYRTICVSVQRTTQDIAKPVSPCQLSMALGG